MVAAGTGTLFNLGRFSSAQLGYRDSSFGVALASSTNSEAASAESSMPNDRLN
jgi:hypothetical protein